MVTWLLQASVHQVVDGYWMLWASVHQVHWYSSGWFTWLLQASVYQVHLWMVTWLIQVAVQLVEDCYLVTPGLCPAGRGWLPG